MKKGLFILSDVSKIVLITSFVGIFGILVSCNENKTKAIVKNVLLH